MSVGRCYGSHAICAQVIDRCYMTSTSKAPDTAPTKTAEPPVTPADAMLEIPPPPPPHQKEGPAEPGAIVAETGVVHAVLPPQDIRHPGAAWQAYPSLVSAITPAEKSPSRARVEPRDTLGAQGRFGVDGPVAR
jgi:hypothetical protein